MEKVASRWAALLGALAVGLLLLVLPEKLTFGPSWIPLAIEIIVALPFAGAWVTGRKLQHLTMRALALTMLGVLTLALASSVALFIINLPNNRHATNLLLSAAVLWVTNILVFSLWYWELDGGGPHQRHLSGHEATDLMFPQQVNGNTSGWVPHFVDYIFVAFTGATALSPADTQPLTQKAKMLMIVEAVLSLTIIVLLAARAVNILGS